MGFVKYSIGQIVGISDGDNEWEPANIKEASDIGAVLVCAGCGLQHALGTGEDKRICECGEVVRGSKN